VAQQYILTVHAPGFIDVRQTVDLLTQNTGYFNIDLIADRDAVGGPVQPVVGIVNAAVPDEAQAAYERGRALLSSHDPASAQAAIRELEHAVSIYPGYLEARIALGIAYMDQRSWEKAEKSLRAAVALNGQASTAQFALAEVYLNEKKYAEGIVSASEGLKANPQSAPGHFTLARLYWAMGPKALDEKDFRTKVESAWAEVSRAISIDPKLAEAHLLAGNMLLKAKRPADALKHFETYLKLEPDGDLAAETTEIADKIRKALKQQQ
jgi:tetratricopeptide (TPR) repeat protein